MSVNPQEKPCPVCKKPIKLTNHNNHCKTPGCRGRIIRYKGRGGQTRKLIFHPKNI